eukprot:259197-Rhodomonas_salina.1
MLDLGRRGVTGACAPAAAAGVTVTATVSQGLRPLARASESRSSQSFSGPTGPTRLCFSQCQCSTPRRQCAS